MNTKFKALEKVLKETAEARQEYKQNVQGLKNKTDYSEEYKSKQEQKFQSELRTLQGKQHEKVVELLSEIEELAEEKHSELNLDSTEFQNALKLIELSGSNLSADTAGKINSNFKSFSALKALETVYDAQGIINKGNIENMVYEIPETYEYLRNASYETFMREGSLNSFSSSVSKVAEKEGIEFSSMVDNAGAVEAMRESAGLQG